MDVKIDKKTTRNNFKEDLRSFRRRRRRLRKFLRGLSFTIFAKGEGVLLQFCFWRVTENHPVKDLIVYP